MPYLHEQNEEAPAFCASQVHGRIPLMASQEGAAWQKVSKIQAMQLFGAVRKEYRS